MQEGFPYRAMILDLDGVITDTRRLHLRAWQETLKEVPGGPLREEEYNDFIDGRPREEGVKAVLSHRQVPVEEKEVSELAKAKDSLYLEALRKEGPVVFKDSVEAIRHWKEEGVPVAVVSSSKNCAEVLEKAGIRDLFDVQIDGKTAEGSHLRGKPEADYFLEAANRLGVSARECAIVEDSVAGIKAGRRGHFKGVIGMSRDGQTPPEKLYAEGAHRVVSSLTEIGKLPNALEAWGHITRHIGKKEPAIFLDFDGTLSEIVPGPGQAKIRPGLVPVLERMGRSLKTGVVSGRDRVDVKERVGVAGLFYAGCHGFDISGPGGFHFQVEEAMQGLPQLKEARTALRDKFHGQQGVVIEDKKFFTAIHYRMVEEGKQEEVVAGVRDLLSRWPLLKAREGKKVIELGPAVDWGKGKAIGKLCEVLDVCDDLTVPFYLGDDLTDEDAFRELNGKGISIKVQDGPDHQTAADYWLKDVAEVEEFLSKIANEYVREEKRWRPGA